MKSYPSKKCKALYDYVRYVARIKVNKQKQLSALEAVIVCIGLPLEKVLELQKTIQCDSQ